MRHFLISTILTVISILGFAVNSNAQTGTYNGDRKSVV